MTPFFHNVAFVSNLSRFGFTLIVIKYVHNQNSLSIFSTVFNFITRSSMDHHSGWMKRYHESTAIFDFSPPLYIIAFKFLIIFLFSLDDCHAFVYWDDQIYIRLVLSEQWKTNMFAWSTSDQRGRRFETMLCFLFIDYTSLLVFVRARPFFALQILP